MKTEGQVVLFGAFEVEGSCIWANHNVDESVTIQPITSADILGSDWPLLQR